MTAANRILLLRPGERTSVEGNTYPNGRLGKARVVAFQAEEPDKFGNPVWQVFVTEPPSSSPPPPRSAPSSSPAAEPGDPRGTEGTTMTTISRRRLVAGLAFLTAAPRALAAAPTVPALEVWKVRACGCCSAWARRFEQAGFAVTMHELDDVTPVRAAAGVPADLAGCHTAKVEGYAVEGHVPVEVVQRLLAERPAVLGLAVPGMPSGAPGMEVEGEPAEPFRVYAFAVDGSRQVFE